MEQQLKQACACLLPERRQALARLPIDTQARCEELRLRVEQPMQIVVGESEQRVGESVFHSAEIKDTLERAAEYSLHTCADSLRQGFLTMRGGHRVGVCGQTAVQDGAMLSFRSISSLNIRIARQIKGAASPELLRQIRDGTHLHNTLFLSPPGWGKTTLLRDIARQLADTGVRTAVADERAELAALYHGVPQFDIGRHTDVIDGCPKAQAAMMLVKTMSPQLLLLDEITSEADIYAAECAAHCGTAVFASAHAWDLEDFQLRPLYQRLQERKIFARIFCIEQGHQVTRLI